MTGRGTWPLDPGGRAEAVEVVRILSTAFRDTPLTRAVVGRGGRRRERSNRAGLRASWRAAADGGVALGAGRAGTLEGVLVAYPPARVPPPPPPPVSQLRALLGQGWRISRRWLEVAQALASLHPPVPAHWYLAVLGIEPAAQGQGLGSALLADWLQLTDAGGDAAYLETDRPENVAFYERVGFGVQQRTTVLGVDVWCMWRPGRSAATRDGPLR